MKHEILFKAKLKYANNEWLEGTDIKQNPLAYDSVCVGNNGNLWHAVVPETLCRYIGLTDCEENKIFENDILEFTNDDGEKSYYTVAFEESCAAFILKDENGCTDNFEGWENVKKYWKVVGNICDEKETSR